MFHHFQQGRFAIGHVLGLGYCHSTLPLATLAHAQKPASQAAIIPPIIDAAQRGHAGRVAIRVTSLLAEVADLNATETTEGRTGLREVNTPGKLDVVKLLIDQGTAVNGAEQIGITPLIQASDAGTTAHRLAKTWQEMEMLLEINAAGSQLGEVSL